MEELAVGAEIEQACADATTRPRPAKMIGVAVRRLSVIGRMALAIGGVRPYRR